MSKVVPPLAILLVEEVIFGFVDTWFGLIYSLVLLTYLVEQFTNKIQISSINFIFKNTTNIEHVV